ncbi:flavodoxin family protein [Bifidobacterium tsurumiense]|uniref:Putative lipoprotein n=1 Tax=Bifidobacterium tsurumiense TaxID=356829 RepID=A0A087EES7_9BIFI|nr:flavodoxin [Bifidobacterium tsurumiense]KFJ06278.1 putative lipoprotein [Bifidobacterium tsurumiense]MDY4678046.1 flavodoxin [Bifidobacterium tsurumiense]MSS12097.1 flavodoxin [Bifidobacterium tsurumiense]
MRNRTRLSYLAALLVSSLFVACSAPQTSQTAQSQEDNTNTQSQSEELMNPSRINAPQVGIPDAQWNQSRGTVSDGNDTNADNDPTLILTGKSSDIIIYFSRSGSTELLASKIQNQLRADALEIVVKDPYSSNYYDTVERANGEREEEDDPELNMDVPDLSAYQHVYLGYPIWGMTLAEPMASFLEEYGRLLSGKTISPFSTNGSYGIGASVQRIQRILGDQGVQADITEAYTIQGNRVNEADSSLKQWLDAVK